MHETSIFCLRDESSSLIDLVDWSPQTPRRALWAVLHVDAGLDECVSEFVGKFVLAGGASADTSAQDALDEIGGIDISLTTG